MKHPALPQISRQGLPDCPRQDVTSEFSFRQRLLSCLAFWLLAGPSIAQTVAPIPAKSESNEAEAVFLSPFEVNTTRDRGFAATDAITGSRIATNMADLPVSYSVVNQEFIQALNITDLTDASTWTTNAHLNIDGQGGGDYFNLPVLTISRGGGNQLRQRNFFLNFAHSDSYNVERYDFGRGPNAVLFGNETLGGNQVTMTKRASFSKAAQTMSVSVGSWDRYRFTLDINQPINKYLAIRVAGVSEDREGWRLNEMERHRAGFITATFKPVRGTEIRVDAEIGKLERNTPHVNLNDSFTGWDGRTVFRGAWLNNQMANTATGAANSLGQITTFNGEPQGVDRAGTNYFVWAPGSASNTIMNYQNIAQTRGGGSTARTPIAGYISGSNASFGSSGGNILYGMNLPEQRFDNAIGGSAFRLPTKRFTMAQDGPLYRMKHKDLQLTVSQQLGESWFLEAAVDANRQYPEFTRAAGLINTRIDINQTLPDGSANPNYLQPFGDTNIQDGYSTQLADAVRGSVAYVKDVGRWGHYSFNLMGGSSHKSIKNGTYTMSLKSNPDPRQWNNTDQVRVRQYWNATSRPTGAEIAGKAITFTDVNFTNVNAPVYSSRTITPDWVISDGANEQNVGYDYVMLANTTKLFKGRWVIMAAARYDDYTAEQKIMAQRYQLGADWDGRSTPWRPDAPADFATLSYRPYIGSGTNSQSPTSVAASNRPIINNTNGVAEADPRYTNDRFRSDYNPPALKGNKISKTFGTVVYITPTISLFASKGESYDTPSTGTLTLFNTLAEPATAKGWDAGMRFTFWDDRLTVKLTRYQNDDFGGVENSTIQGPINGLFAANIVGDPDTVGRNRRGAGDIIGGRDIRDRKSSGYEMEVSANLTRGMRLSGNVGTVDISRTNYFPWTRQIVEANRALFVQILQDAGGRIKTGVDPAANNAAELDSAVITPGNAGDNQRAVDNYNLINANYNGLPPFSQKLQTRDSITANVFLDYTWQTGKLRGFKLGLGYQYRERNVLNYRGADTIEERDVNGNRIAVDNPNVDSTSPIFIDMSDNMIATVGYAWRLKQGRVIDFNLRINNLLNKQGVYYQDPNSALRPLGGDYTSPARETVASAVGQYQQPINFFMTATIKF